MFMRHTLWLIMSIVFLLLTGGIHSLSLIGGPQPTNDTEKQMIDLMTTYHMSLDPYFSPTMMDFFTDLSSCFTWLYLFGGILLIYLLRKKVANDILKGVTGIYVIFFGISFAMALAFTFIYPIVLTALCFLFLAMSYFLIPKTT
jgi:hypothetical protein